MSEMTELVDTFFNRRPAVKEPDCKLVVACKAGCGRVATITWSQGARLKLVNFTCRCGAVTPIDGEGT